MCTYFQQHMLLQNICKIFTNVWHILFWHICVLAHIFNSDICPISKSVSIIFKIWHCFLSSDLNTPYHLLNDLQEYVFF